MSSKTVITVSGIDVQVVRKHIKNLHLGVYPPDGRVRVAVPEHVTDDNVRLAVVSKLSWIKKQQRDFEAQPRQSERAYISGECHYVFGRRCRLELVERAGKPAVERLQSGKLKLFVRPEASVEAKEKVLNDWYREQLKRHHNERFKTLMDQFIPYWRTSRKTLNQSPLAHEDWGF